MLSGDAEARYLRALLHALSRTRPMSDRASATPGGRALGRNRTYDTRFRKPVLYPLSYEGIFLKNRRRLYHCALGDQPRR